MKVLRKRTIWILLTLFLLPVLAFGVWYALQVRQHRLDHALIEAIKKDDSQTTIALLEHGANANALDKPEGPLTLKEVWTEFWRRLHPANSQVEPVRYNSALLVLLTSHTNENGIIKGDILPVAQALLEHGANSNAEDIHGDSALMVASGAAGDDEDAGKVVVLLLEKGAVPNFDGPSHNTPLMYMIVNGQEQAVKLLLEQGADPNVRNLRDYTPLANAVEADDPAMVQWLVDKGANPNVPYNDANCTPLKTAKKRGNSKIVQMLLRSGAKE